MDDVVTCTPMQPVERWRYLCPRGHTGWEMTGRAFWCAQCYQREPDAPARFERLRDQKTDERVDAQEFRSRRAAVASDGH